MNDLLSPRAWRNTAGYAMMRELLGLTNHLGIPLGSSDDRSVALSALRAGPDFSDREMLVAQHLRRVVQAAHRHVQAVIALEALIETQERSAAPSTQSDFGLTPRDRVILGLMGNGLTTTGIACKLVLSPRTVSKHQEHIYRKLAVSDRLTAVLKASAGRSALPAMPTTP